MNIQLMRLRRAAGFKNRQSFAAALGITVSKLKRWETDDTQITLEDACLCADILGCTLDELAGRTPPTGNRQQRMLNDSYIALSDAGRDAALTVVRGLLASETARGIQGEVDNSLKVQHAQA